MISARPFKTAESVLSAATTTFDLLPRTEVIKAFYSRPRLGDLHASSVGKLRACVLVCQHATIDKWSQREDHQAFVASKADVEELLRLDEVYERIFNYRPILFCMPFTVVKQLEIMKARLGSKPHDELENNKIEERKIIVSRLTSLLAG
jgi:2-oxo-4-hydroxy-4-carboxy--5-ureidoimidazoline (OHCU) decarboxylase